MSSACIPCVRELHEECRNPKSDKCCCTPDSEPTPDSSSEVVDEAALDSEIEKPKTARVRTKIGVGISAGRKRAATLYPLSTEEACEWRGLWNCGGGLFPIVGCDDGLQEARHHGPVKNTEVNHRGNVHLICHNCHNRWHAANDPHYDRDDKEAEARFALLPHQPRNKDGSPHE